MLRHLDTCVPDAGEKATQSVFRIRVDSADRPEFWLDLELRSDAPLARLDRFLRDVWLECCGHLSMFRIGELRYAHDRDDFWDDPQELTMQVRAGHALASADKPFFYEYDFGSTTELRLRVTGRSLRPSRREHVRLLARNLAPDWSCTTCGEAATSICSYCVYEAEEFACPKHEKAHGECDDDGWLRVVNSPRIGICGYGG